MVAKYVRKLEEGSMNFYDVPNLWSAKVRKQIEADGYIVNDDGTVVKEQIDETLEVSED